MKHEDLDAFKCAPRPALRVYQVTRTVPREATMGLRSQLRRAAVSVVANIAEGAGRFPSAEYRRFVGIAQGSAVEASYYLLLGYDLSYISKDDYEDLHNEYENVCKMLTRLGQALMR